MLLSVIIGCCNLCWRHSDRATWTPSNFKAGPADLQPEQHRRLGEGDGADVALELPEAEEHRGAGGGAVAPQPAVDGLLGGKGEGEGEGDGGVWGHGRDRNRQESVSQM